MCLRPRPGWDRNTTGRGPRQEELGGPPLEIPSLDASGVVPCPTHGMDHLTRDPSCEFCKRALGLLYRHLKGKYGSRLEDQTPTLSFDFSGPFPISATGSRFMLLFVRRLSDIRLLWAFALDRRTNENVRSCLQDVVAELTQMTGGSKPPVMRVHSDQAGEFLSPVVMEWLKQHNIRQTFMSGYDPAANGWTAPGFGMGGRFPLAVQDMCQRLMTHGAFANYHSTPIREWHKVRHMLTLKRDDDTRSSYAHDAKQAWCQYTDYASANGIEIQQLLLDVATVEYSSWATKLDSIAAMVNTGSGMIELPASQVEQMEKRSRVAEEALMDQVQMADAANARRKEKNREKKEKRARSTNPTSPQPTVSLHEYVPPPEQSSDEGDVAKKLDFDAEAPSQQADVPEPNTPEQLLQQPAPLDEFGHPHAAGHDPGLPSSEVDAPERVEEQQSREDTGQTGDESDKPPPEGDKPEGNEEQGSGEGQESSKQPPDPPDPPEPPDPDAPDPNPEEKEVDDVEEIVESESTKQRRKVAEHQQKVYHAAMTRLPFTLAEKRPLYKGTEITPKERPKPSIRWRPKKGAIPKPADRSPIDHRGNRAFENIRDHQISSLFTLQKHLADCEKGAKERNSSLKPLRTKTGGIFTLQKGVDHCSN